MDYLYACLTEKKPQSGSIYYYAYRHCDKNTTQTLYALDQLKYQWIKASELYVEPYPSLQKLQWWQQCLQDPIANRNHPIVDRLCRQFDTDTLIHALTPDLTYALTTIAEGRNYHSQLDLSQSFLGIATLKAQALGFEDKTQIQMLNHIDELLRHLLLVGKHFARNIVLDELFKPHMDKQSFKQITHKLLTHVQSQKLQLKLPQQQLKPLILLHRQQYLCAKKFSKKIDNPFTQSLRIPPFALLFSTVFASKL